MTGDRVRIWHRSPCCPNPLIGLADSVTSDAVWMKTGREAVGVAVPAGSISHVDKWVPVHHSTVPLVVGGLVSGAGFGLLMDVFFKTVGKGDDYTGYRTKLILGGSGLGLISGLLVAMAEKARWEAASLQLPALR
jgi:hypothetical protein